MYHHRGEDSDLRTTLERLSTLRELTIDGEVDYAPHTLVEKIRSPLRILRFNIIRPSSWYGEHCNPAYINAYLPLSFQL